MTTKTKALILDSLAKVDHPGFAGDCIRLFVSEAHLKMNSQIKRAVRELQDQIKDNPDEMKKVLGNQFEFIRTVNVGEALPALPVG